VELTALWSGGLSWRRLAVLIKHLPAESATMTALRNAAPVEQLKESAAVADYGSWSQTDMLLAELIDIASWLRWTKTKDAEKNQNQPGPYPRPGVNRKPRPALNTKVIDLLEFVRKNNGAAPTGYIESKE
jgi:hypothetical protein